MKTLIDRKFQFFKVEAPLEICPVQRVPSVLTTNVTHPTCVCSEKHYCQIIEVEDAP